MLVGVMWSAHPSLCIFPQSMCRGSLVQTVASTCVRLALLTEDGASQPLCDIIIVVFFLSRVPSLRSGWLVYFFENGFFYVVLDAPELAV